MSARDVSIVLAIVLAACAEQYHVRLEPPRPDITPDERVALFWQRRATAQSIGTTNQEWSNQTLFLGDNQPGSERIEVVSPEDLEPLVGPDSETMQHARRSITARDKARRWSTVSIAVLLAGFVAGVALERGEDRSLPWGWITFGATAVTASITYAVARRAMREELTWRRRAFTTYTRDLGLRLDVCAHGMQVVPCEAAEKPPPGRTALRMR